MKRQGPWHFIEELVLEHNPCFLCIAEPLIKPPTVLPPLFSRLGFSARFLHNDTPPRVGNLWLFWKDELTVDLVDVSHQQITVKVGNFLLSFVHASSSYDTRRGLWQELGSLGNTVDAWAVVGDFNIVSSVIERRGGRSPCITAMNEFNSFIHSNALIDSTTYGFNYSWCNKRWGIKECYVKIDRMLVNQKWIEVSTGWRSKILKSLSCRTTTDCGLELASQAEKYPFRFRKLDTT
ncbi:hypothetical protein IFM89_019893 [Coptis chinensis]|uniref:Endonuclease/exonuclease/phosphatase domain-containing protein n=1 Tax=Coptis chinensis TaxID=261450 RepID=A0A835I4X4_9MAGN|nr:hypothetical protein IFM89_019893 [Coptis chinensis]